MYIISFTIFVEKENGEYKSNDNSVWRTRWWWRERRKGQTRHFLEKMLLREKIRRKREKLA